MSQIGFVAVIAVKPEDKKTNRVMHAGNRRSSKIQAANGNDERSANN